MNYPTEVLFSDKIATDDEIDNLFCQLEQIQPPPELVEKILASVAQLSIQAKTSSFANMYADSTVCNDSLQPS